jgi:hypothetical protein
MLQVDWIKYKIDCSVNIDIGSTLRHAVVRDDE